MIKLQILIVSLILSAIANSAPTFHFKIEREINHQWLTLNSNQLPLTATEEKSINFFNSLDWSQLAQKYSFLRNRSFNILLKDQPTYRSVNGSRDIPFEVAFNPKQRTILWSQPKQPQAIEATLIFELALAYLQQVYGADFPSDAHTWYDIHSIGDRRVYEYFEPGLFGLLRRVWMGSLENFCQKADRTTEQYRQESMAILAASRLDPKVVFFKTLAQMLVLEPNAMEPSILSMISPIIFIHDFRLNRVDGYDYSNFYQVEKPKVFRDDTLKNEVLVLQAMRELWKKYEASFVHPKSHTRLDEPMVQILFEPELIQSIIEQKPANLQHLSVIYDSLRPERDGRGHDWYLQFFLNDEKDKREYMRTFEGDDYYKRRIAQSNDPSALFRHHEAKEKRQLIRKAYENLLAEDHLEAEIRYLNAAFEKLEPSILGCKFAEFNYEGFYFHDFKRLVDELVHSRWFHERNSDIKGWKSSMVPDMDSVQQDLTSRPDYSCLQDLPMDERIQVYRQMVLWRKDLALTLRNCIEKLRSAVDLHRQMKPAIPSP